MSVYAVYGRASENGVWNVLELCATQEEADRFASRAVEAAQTEGGGPQAAVVVEWERREDVPAHLPEAWVAPVVSRYGEADAPAAMPPAESRESAGSAR